jgi:putative colanic acid biosynthesis acetyltransferase WcaF
MDKNSTLGPFVNVYNQGLITIGKEVIISQGSHLCASTHDYNHSLHPLVLKPIVIEDHVWVCADAFVGPGVILAEGSVIGARAAIFKNSQSWTVYSGNPAQIIKQRENFTRG